MNWKSTALASGAGVLATWLAGYGTPADTTPVPATAPVAPVVAAVAASRSGISDAEIQALATQLARRVDDELSFERPNRNLFRFTPRPVARAATVALPAAGTAAPVAAVAAAPGFGLSGVAMDHGDGGDVWTAILSAPGGVVLARVGDAVGDGWRVTAIEAESVSLRRPDGTVQILSLAGR